MSYYQQQNRRRLTIGQDGNALTLLIAINLVVFVLLAFTKVVYFFSYGKVEGTLLFNDQVLHWLTLPASLENLATRPWTLITHMFVHNPADVWHIIANMLWLWAFGHILQDLTGNRKITPIYIYGGFAGALAYILAFNLIPALRVDLEFAEALGASAGIMAIAIATTVLAPNYRIFPMLNGGIPLWVITVIFLVIDLATIPENNPGGHIAHIAGAGMGFLFMVQLGKGRDWSGWINQFFDWTTNLFNPEKPAKGKAVKTQLFYNSKVQPYKKTPLITQQRIDEILDKIHQKGYQSLTEDEKEMLKRASKEDL
jgi:membrane associated rhomboid family serine protease